MFLKLKPNLLDFIHVLTGSKMFINDNVSIISIELINNTEESSFVSVHKKPNKLLEEGRSLM